MVDALVKQNGVAQQDGIGKAGRRAQQLPIVVKRRLPVIVVQRAGNREKWLVVQQQNGIIARAGELQLEVCIAQADDGDGKVVPHQWHLAHQLQATVVLKVGDVPAERAMAVCSGLKPGLRLNLLRDVRIGRPPQGGVVCVNPDVCKFRIASQILRDDVPLPLCCNSGHFIGIVCGQKTAQLRVDLNVAGNVGRQIRCKCKGGLVVDMPHRSGVLTLLQ